MGLRRRDARGGAALRAARGCPTDPGGQPPHPAVTLRASSADDLRPAIGDLDALRAWCARSARPFHLEIDTGMAPGRVPMGRRGGRSPSAAAESTEPPGVGRRLHPLPLRRSRIPPSIECQWRALRGGARGAARGGLRWSMPPTARRHCAGPDTPPTWPGPASSSTAVRHGRRAWRRDRWRRCGHAWSPVRQCGPGRESVSYGATWTAPPARCRSPRSDRLRGRPAACDRRHRAAAARRASSLRGPRRSRSSGGSRWT